MGEPLLFWRNRLRFCLYWHTVNFLKKKSWLGWEIKKSVHYFVTFKNIKKEKVITWVGVFHTKWTKMTWSFNLWSLDFYYWCHYVSLIPATYPGWEKHGCHAMSLPWSYHGHGETWSWSCHDDGMAAMFLDIYQLFVTFSIFKFLGKKMHFCKRLAYGFWWVFSLYTAF